jgi:hypothetical protein
MMPKAQTPEGGRLGREMEIVAGLVPSIATLQNIVAPAARNVAAGTANRLMNSVLKPSIKQLQKEPKLGFKAAKMGLTGSKERIADKAEKLIVENEAKLEKIISNSKGEVDAGKIADNLESLKRPFANTGDEASVSAIEKLQYTLIGKGKLSVQDANQLKRDFYSGLKPTAYGQGTSKLGASVQAEKAAARGLKEGIELAEPTKPIGAINRKTGVAGMVRDAASRQDLMQQKTNLMGLLDMGMGAGGVISGNIPAGLGAVAGRKILGSDYVKSKLAQLLANLV